MTTPLLVIGYGNELRGDDAVGPQAARHAASWRRPDVAEVAVPQLTPELAAALGDAEAVVFVDASAEPSQREVRLRRLEAGPGTPTCADRSAGHTSDPRWLLALTEAVYGRRPEAWLVTVPAADFRLGAPLSAAARAGLVVALRRIDRLIRARNRERGAVSPVRGPDRSQALREHALRTASATTGPAPQRRAARPG